jgi:guanylate kinase
MKKLITITGSSFSGKSTIESFLINSVHLDVNYIISTTTRERRAGESNDDYHFVTHREFKLLLANEELLEHSMTTGKLYGISKEGIAQSFESSDTVAVVVDPSGVKALTEYCRNKAIQLTKVYVSRKFWVCLSGLVKRVTTGEVKLKSGLKRIARFVTKEYWWRFSNYDLVINNNHSLEESFNIVRELCFKIK